MGLEAPSCQELGLFVCLGGNHEGMASLSCVGLKNLSLNDKTGAIANFL